MESDFIQRFGDNTAVFRWVRPRPRGQTLGGDPCLSTGDTREALPARAQAHQLGRTHLKTAVIDSSAATAGCIPASCRDICREQ
jgi:hypothetical protein